MGQCQKKTSLELQEAGQVVSFSGRAKKGVKVMCIFCYTYRKTCEKFIFLWERLSLTTPEALTGPMIEI